jgi:uncharacterized protein YndB with AHSA1/START domain
MRSNLLFDFIVNKENKTIEVKKEFKADLILVWNAWTQADLLDQWWAPKPYINETKSLNFKEGGQWLYAMLSPEGIRHWCKADYVNIDAPKMFSYIDAFCDEEGNANGPLPSTHWTNVFIDKGEITRVDITLTYNSIEDLEEIIKLGFKEGFTMGLENLEQYLEKQVELDKNNNL